jgi:hypothetical protein
MRHGRHLNKPFFVCNCRADWFKVMGAVCMGCAAGQRMVCAFEGGSKCRHENWLLQKDGSNAFKGMHCSWVGEHCLAMQRPSTRINVEHGIPSAFAAAGIKAVVCLQERGEHEHCGDGVHAANGLSYMPEEFMKEDVSFYHFPWRDMDTPDIDTAMRIAQVMTHHVDSGGKVAVHCHAGLGRTGLVIACWLVLGGLASSAAAAVSFVRRGRRGALQTRKQVRFVYEFEDALIRAWDVFGHSSSVASADNAVMLQRWALHGRTRQRLGHVPRLLAEAATLWIANLAAPSQSAASQPDTLPASPLIEFLHGVLSLLSLSETVVRVAAPAGVSEPTLPGAVLDVPQPLDPELAATACSAAPQRCSDASKLETWNELTRDSILALLKVILVFICRFQSSSPPSYSCVQGRHHGHWPDLTKQTPAFMFALVETWFSSLPAPSVPKVGTPPTRAARAIASCIRGVFDAVAPPPALRQALQLLFSLCISGRGRINKAARIQAAVQIGIDGFRDGGSSSEQPDALAVLGDLSDAFGFLFPTEQ